MQKIILDAVRSNYADVAKSTLSSEHAGVKAVAEAFGYDTAELDSIPARANMGLSCGNPTAMASLRPGEVVLDLGSGGGLDVFLAANKVGPQGKAIGIDMTQEMVERAQNNAAEGGYTNVAFYLSTIDKIPLPSASVDCVLSNCVLNLAPDKPAVFREIARVLKPGGRLAASDIALRDGGILPAEVASSMAAYVGCIAGAISIESYRDSLLAAGFQHVAIVDSGANLNIWAKQENQSSCGASQGSPAQGSPVASGCCSSSSVSNEAGEPHKIGELLTRYDINQAVASVKVFAVKP